MLRIANRIVDVLIITFLLLAFAIGLYISIDAKNVYEGAREYQQLRNYVPEAEETEEILQEISENAVAWVTIDDTPISYPVVQGKDNMEYLSKDPEGNDSISGSIFLDVRNRSDFSDSYNIVYGHHMPDKLMFGALDDFSEQDFFLSHRTGLLSLPGKQIPFQTAAFLIVPVGCNEIFETESGTDYPAYFQEQAVFYDPSVMTGHLAALTTCAEDAARFREVLILALEE